MTLANPFDDLDNAMITTLFSFIEAPDALVLACSCRRLFHIHSQSQKNRLSHQYDAIIMDFAENQNVPWKIRLGDRAVSKPRRPLFVTFVEEPLEEPDFFISEQTPLLELYAKVEDNKHARNWKYYSHPAWMWKINLKEPLPTLKCHVKVGDDRYAMIVLFKVLQERFALNQLFVDGAEAEMLNWLTLFPLPLVRHLQVLPKESPTEDAIVRLVQEMPQLESLTVHGWECSFSSDFYYEPAILKLPTFVCFGGTCNADYSQVKWRNFVFFNGILSNSSATVEGIKFLLEEWKADEREIDFWRFDFDLGVLWVGEAAERIFDGFFERKQDTKYFNQWSGVLKSKSGKKLQAKVCHYCGLEPEIILTTIDWEEHWRCFLQTFDS